MKFIYNLFFKVKSFNLKEKLLAVIHGDKVTHQLSDFINNGNKVVLVYNVFSIDALIAAAFIKSLFPKINVFNLTQAVPSDGDHYLWVGIKRKGFQAFADKVNGPDQVHRFINHGPEDYMIVEDVWRKYSLLEIVYKQIGGSFNTGTYDSFALLGNAIINFENEKFKRDIEWLSSGGSNVCFAQCVHNHIDYLYRMGKLAEAVIHNLETDFINKIDQEGESVMTTWSSSHEDEYHAFILSMKRRLTNNVTVRNVLENGEVVKAAFTNFHIGYETIWMNRLIKHTYQYHVNVAYGYNGTLLDTNVTEPKKLGLKEEFCLSTEF